MVIAYGLIGALVRLFRRRSREPASPRHAVQVFMEAMQAPGAKWKAHIGDRHAAPDANHDIGCFTFFPAKRGEVTARFEAMGTSSRLEIGWQGAELLIEYVKGEVSSFYFNNEKFDDVHPEVRLNKNLLTQALRSVYRAVGFYVGRLEKSPLREYARPQNERPLEYGRAEDKRKKKRRKRTDDAE